MPGVTVEAERDGEAFVLELDDPVTWVEHRWVRQSIATWWFVVHQAVELPAGYPRRLDLRAAGVQPFA